MPGAMEGLVVMMVSLFGALIPLALLGLILYLLFQIRQSAQDLAYEMRDTRVALKRAMERTTGSQAPSAPVGEQRSSSDSQ